eukprot:11186574-Karenia_brevis.AAC.1
MVNEFKLNMMQMSYRLKQHGPSIKKPWLDNVDVDIHAFVHYDVFPDQHKGGNGYSKLSQT